MRRLLAIMICLSVCVFFPGMTAIAGSGADPGRAGTVRLRDVEVRPDGYGGYFYQYRDKAGHTHTTNCVDFIPDAFKEARKADRPAPTVAEASVPAGEADAGEDAEEMEGPEEEEDDADRIADPLEPLNRVFFQFNDRLYFWCIKPLATGYGKVVPEPVRIGVRNFFSNLCMPIRAVNCLLQGKIRGFGIEISRFVMNSTVGVAGLWDPAKKIFRLEPQNEDFGQTLGSLGMGPGIYINWPILGPSSIRDSVGSVGDEFLNPVNYGIDRLKYRAAIYGYDKTNRASLTLGTYEALKKAAFDPYVALREAYFENRRYLIER